MIHTHLKIYMRTQQQSTCCFILQIWTHNHQTTSLLYDTKHKSLPLAFFYVMFVSKSNTALLLLVKLMIFMSVWS